MIETKEMKRKKNEIKSARGITLVSLIITIVLMVIISSTSIYVSYERFELNKLKKMYNDIELLSDKVSSYYLKYNGLPVVKDDLNNQIQYTYTTLEFDKNVNDNDKYYILDLTAMEDISLNYGKEGFENLNTSDDVYIINEKSHQIYYVKGITVDDITYYTIQYDADTMNDNIPPSKPEIKVIAGTTDDNGTYLTEVKVEIIPGNDSWSGIEKTTYSVNGSTEADITNLTNNIYDITTDGTYEINARSYDKNGNISEYATQTIVVSKASIILDKTELSLEKDTGATVTAELVATLENVSKDFKWTASEDSGLIISGEGNTKTITATKTVENATITVSYGTLSTTCTVTVVESGYTTLEYIESTGTQYIDTGITCNENLKIEVKYAISSFDVNRSYIFGVYGSSDSYRVQYSHSNVIFAGFGNMCNDNITAPTEDKQYYLVMDNGKFTLDGEEIYDATSAGGKYSASNTATIYLFARNGNGTVGNFGSNRIYECKMYIGETLVRDFVPCKRDSDGVIGLYDKVNKVFYTNAGTGTFVEGPEV